LKNGKSLRENLRDVPSFNSFETHPIEFAHYTPRKKECNHFVNKNRPSRDGLNKEEERERALPFHFKRIQQEIFQVSSAFLSLKQGCNHQFEDH
jgi:hypothetical protein